MPALKLKQLESYLQEVETFDEPNVGCRTPRPRARKRTSASFMVYQVLLEQYPTSAHIAAVILFTAQNTYGAKICPYLVLRVPAACCSLVRAYAQDLMCTPLTS